MKITNDDFTSHVCDDPSKDGDGLGWSLEADMTTEGKDELIQNQKLRELIEKDIKRCFGELICPKNAEYGTALQKLLHEADKK